MGEVKQINIKNQTYYFNDDMIKLLKIEKKYYKGINIYYVGYITTNKLMIMKVFTVCEAFVFAC